MPQNVCFNRLTGFYYVKKYICVYILTQLNPGCYQRSRAQISPFLPPPAGSIFSQPSLCGLLTHSPHTYLAHRNPVSLGQELRPSALTFSGLPRVLTHHGCLESGQLEIVHLLHFYFPPSPNSWKSPLSPLPGGLHGEAQCGVV